MRGLGPARDDDGKWVARAASADGQFHAGQAGVFQDSFQLVVVEAQPLVADTLANRDNLPEDYVRSILKLPERVRQRYVYGSWDVFEGQIFVASMNEAMPASLSFPSPW